MSALRDGRNTSRGQALYRPSASSCPRALARPSRGRLAAPRTLRGAFEALLRTLQFLLDSLIWVLVYFLPVFLLVFGLPILVLIWLVRRRRQRPA